MRIFYIVFGKLTEVKTESDVRMAESLPYLATDNETFRVFHDDSSPAKIEKVAEMCQKAGTP